MYLNDLESRPLTKEEIETTNKTNGWDEYVDVSGTFIAESTKVGERFRAYVHPPNFTTVRLLLSSDTTDEVSGREFTDDNVVVCVLQHLVSQLEEDSSAVR